MSVIRDGLRRDLDGESARASSTTPTRWKTSLRRRAKWFPRGLLAGLSLLLPACDSSAARGFVIHPIPDSLTAPPGEVIVLTRTRGPDSEAAARKIRAFRERFERREIVGRIGDLDGGEETTFALLWDAAVTDAGEVLILDRIQAVVRVFTATGEYLYTLGGQGEGPGELQVPEAVLISPEGDLVVVDQAQLIHRFTKRGGRFEFEDRRRFAAVAYDGCLAGEDLVLHAMRSGRHSEILYREARGDAPELRFAVPYRYSRALVYETVSRGQVACERSGPSGVGGIAVIAYRERNGIEGYDAGDGRLIWQSRIEEFRPAEIREETTGDRRVRRGIFDNDALHFLDRITGGNGLPVLVQYQFHLSEDLRVGTGRYTIETWALDPETGEGESWGDSLPSMLAVTDEYVVFSYDEPYPRVEVARIPR